MANEPCPYCGKGACDVCDDAVGKYAHEGCAHDATWDDIERIRSSRKRQPLGSWGTPGCRPTSKPMTAMAWRSKSAPSGVGHERMATAS